MTDRVDALPKGHRQWTGPAGLAGFRAFAHCTTRDPAAFRVRLGRVDFAGIRLEEWRTSELAVQTTAGDEVALVQVLAGGLRCVDPRTRWSAVAQQLVVLAAGEPRRWSLTGGTYLRVVRVPVALVPPRLLDPVESGVVAASDVTAAFTTALTALGDAALRRPVPSDFVGHGLRALALAVLDERRRESGGTSDDLRQRIERYVEAHLADPELAPGSIAEAFGVSLRWVHQAFNRDGETLAQHIRLRRADAVADEVRRGGWTAGTGALAAAYGFSSRDHLGRVFRARYGMTVAEFQTAAVAGMLPAALPVERAS